MFSERHGPAVGGRSSSRACRVVGFRFGSKVFGVHLAAEGMKFCCDGLAGPVMLPNARP